MKKKIVDFIYSLDKSATLTVTGVILLFSSAIAVTLIAPSYLDKSWTEPSSSYQVQMYEVADPNIYISTLATGTENIQSVYHIKDNYTLLSFREVGNLRIIAPKEMEQYITRAGDKTLKLTSKLLLLRKPLNRTDSTGFNGAQEAEKRQLQLQNEWIANNPNWEREGKQKPFFDIRELYKPEGKEAFAHVDVDERTDNWVDENYTILEGANQKPHHLETGVLYVLNPEEYTISFFKFGEKEGFKFDPMGDPIKDLKELKSERLGFLSRKKLIRMGEQTYASEGCFYCHTDQTRTLVQDTVLNGSESYPAPPSSGNEYIYQKITFPGTRRIGPDLSRVGIKRPSRDWHRSHFWSPKTASAGTIMPAFRHFFDDDPRGTSRSPVGVPNYRFEAVYQYLMTKGTRITPPTQAWWEGKDPVKTKEIIEGKRKAERERQLAIEEAKRAAEVGEYAR